MYLDHFGLKQKPFLITPDPAFLFPSRAHQQALAHLEYGLKREGGFMLLTGEVGTGKTTLCRLLIEQLPDDFRLAYVLNARLDSVGMLAGICRELGIEYSGQADLNQLVATLYDDLLESHAAGRHTLVIVEEAQNLPPDVLETLRLLTNLETSTTKLMHILLIGQPELLETLGQPGLRQLNQRVVSRCHLGSLSRQELGLYLKHRLQVAGCSSPLFTAAAVRAIYRKTGGLPRLVNLLAEHCLMGAYGLNRKRVTAGMTCRAAAELWGGERRWTYYWARAGVFVVAVCGLALGGLWIQGVDTVWRVSAKSDNSREVMPLTLENRQPITTGAEEIAVTPVEETVEEAAPDAFELLLRAWGVNESPASVESVCTIALTRGLRCETVGVTSLVDIQLLNRPLLVSLHNGSDSLEYFVISAVKGESLVLENSSGRYVMEAPAMLARLQGEGVILWQPPQGFDGPLVQGAVNPSLVKSLMAALGREGYLQEPLVTGGVYSEFLAELVKRFQADHGLEVDGIVGLRTLLTLNAGDEPELVMR